MMRPGSVKFETKWPPIRETISATLQLKPVKRLDWNDHCSDIYTLCEAYPVSFADRLYQETRSFLEVFVQTLYQQLYALEQGAMVQAYQKHWLAYRQGVRYLDNLFSYFNRVVLAKYRPSTTDPAIPSPQTPQRKLSVDSPIEISQLALQTWKNLLLDKLINSLVQALLVEIRKDYTRQDCDLTMVQDVVYSFIEVEENNKEQPLKFYQELFEEPFLEETREHYRREASIIVANSDCYEYMEQVVQKLRDAKKRGQRFLHKTSHTKYMRECEAHLIEDYKDDYLYAHTRTMMKEERFKDLSNLYFLLSGIPRALDPIISNFEEHVTAQGLAALSRLQLDKNPDVVEYVAVALGTFQKYHDMVKDIFGANKDFFKSLEKVCRVFINHSDQPKQPPKAPLLLAKYCDQLLKKGADSLGESKVDDKLQDAIALFRFIDDKDMFQRFYSKMLARRLVNSLSLSMETEENMVQKLKHACGFEYTAKLQKMLVDINLSAFIMQEFNESTKSSIMSGFSVLVLQSGAWPFQQQSLAFRVPEELVNVISKFEVFYSQKHSGRKLTWLHQHATGEMKLNYLKKPYFVSMSTYQMAILIAFNGSVEQSYSTLAEHTLLEEKELVAVLQSLVDCKLLEQTTEGAVEVTSKCVLRVNEAYSNKRTKFKITTAAQKETIQETEQTQHSVQEDRKLVIQAAIVRVMKSRKILKHNLLIEETINQTKSRFSPHIPMIKKCIESLIEKQYLERVEGSLDTYSYLA